MVRVGDTASLSQLLRNVAMGALVDDLTGSLSGTVAPFSGDAGSLGTGVAGNGGETQVSFALDTTNAGIFAGSATLHLASHDSELIDVALDSIDFTLAGTVNNLADPQFSFNGGDGTFAGSHQLYTLDFGSISELADTLFSANLKLMNSANGPADDLMGMFDVTGAGVFALGGFDPLTLSAGDMFGGLSVLFDTSAFGPGAFAGSVFFHSKSVFAGLNDVDLAPIELRFSGRIVAADVGVPAPAALPLLLVGLLGLLLARRRTGVVVH